MNNDTFKLSDLGNNDIITYEEIFKYIVELILYNNQSTIYFNQYIKFDNMLYQLCFFLYTYIYIYKTFKSS